MKEKKVRVHNRSQRAFTIPPAYGKQGKDREILPGRAVDLEESTALKYLKLYPVELIRYNDLVTPDDDEEKETLKSENEALKKRLAELEGKVSPEPKKVGRPPKSEAEKKSGLSGILEPEKE
jgi:hypothetical protein